MIKCNSKNTTIRGSLAGVSQDFVNVVYNIKKFFAKSMPEDLASRCVVTCVKLAYAEDEDDKEKRDNLEKELFDTFVKAFEVKKEVIDDEIV
jgi:hypothetical protein